MITFKEGELVCFKQHGFEYMGILFSVGYPTEGSVYVLRFVPGSLILRDDSNVALQDWEPMLNDKDFLVHSHDIIRVPKGSYCWDFYQEASTI